MILERNGIGERNTSRAGAESSRIDADKVHPRRMVVEELPVELVRDLPDDGVAIREQHVDAQAGEPGRLEVLVEIDNTLTESRHSAGAPPMIP
jgi:hypothetical protein